MAADQRTIDAYNQMAEAYDAETSDFWDKFPRTFLHEFITRSGPRIIDIGSGPGRDGLLLREAGKEVLCVDASEQMVAMSTARGLPTILGSFDALPVDDASYDGVWSYTALLHTPKAELDIPLQEMVRVLRPGGVVALGMIEGEGEGYRESSDIGQARWFSYYTHDEVVHRCAAHGLACVYSEIFTPGKRRYLNSIFTHTVI